MLLHKTFSLVSVLSRSKEEVIYDLDLLTSLPSQAFNHLRQTRNRLLTSNKVCFEKINNSNLHVGFKLIEHWSSVQGYKYSKNKMDKEKFVLEKLVSFSYTHPELNLLLGKVGSFTCSLSIFFLHPQFLQYGIIYMLKGINRSEEGGIRGASDATYLHIFSQLKKLGAKINLETINLRMIQEDYIRPRNYQALLFGEVLEADPDPFAFWHSSQKRDPGLNLSLYDNKKVDKLLEEARQILDPETREKKYKEFQELLINDLPAVFLYSPAYLYPVDTKIKGISFKNLSLPSQRFSQIENWHIKTDRVWK